MTLSTIATNKAADLSPPRAGHILPAPYALAFWLILLAVALLGVANCAVRRPRSAITNCLSVMESTRVEYSKRAIVDFQQMAVYYAL